MASAKVFDDPLHCTDCYMCYALGALLAAAELAPRMYQVAIILRRPRDLHRILLNESVRERHLYEFRGMPAQEVVRDTTLSEQSLSLESPGCLNGSIGNFATDYPQAKRLDHRPSQHRCSLPFAIHQRSVSSGYVNAQRSPKSYIVDELERSIVRAKGLVRKASQQRQKFVDLTAS